MSENISLPPSALEQSVKFLKGVGENRARLLAKMGISKVIDLLEYFPKAYVNRKLNPSLFAIQPGDILAFTAMISWVDVRSTPRGKQILNVGVSDGKVALVCSWFSFRKSFEQQFLPGRLLWLSGVLSEFNGQYQMVHPEVEFIEEDDPSEGDFWKKREVLPVYPLTEGVTQKFMRRLVFYAFSLFTAKLEEKLPPAILERHAFVERKTALQKMHFGQNPEEIKQILRRFAYEDLFYSQLLWARHKVFHTTNTEGICFENKKLLTRALYAKLPFQLTSAQKQALREIFADMSSAKQMSRLLEGDVGCGKTVVTVFAMLLAVENGYQAAIMAPTEILADQHFHSISGLLEDMDVEICLLKGGVYKGKNQIKEDILSGKAQIVIGTH
ncbi:MAG: DEAD/DEAH box helicase, partial [Candidatus Cloacimonas sp.]|nr:DEAD/DEAH box helicase [Candidatus Cloacimonas sp.]